MRYLMGIKGEVLQEIYFDWTLTPSPSPSSVKVATKKTKKRDQLILSLILKDHLNWADLVLAPLIIYRATLSSFYLPICDFWNKDDVPF